MADDATTMHVAALRGDLASLQKLAPQHVNAATNEGYTPLSLSASAGMVDACRLLLREGACVDAADQTGVTALMHACMHGNAVLVDLLLLHGANPRTPKDGGQTAVGLAAQYGRPAALGALFRADASLVEATDGTGRTALHWGVLSQHAPTVKYLLGRWGADVTAADAEDNTPLHLLKSDHSILLYLVHGTGVRPQLGVRNLAGETPAERVVKEGESSPPHLAPPHPPLAPRLLILPCLSSPALTAPPPFASLSSPSLGPRLSPTKALTTWRMPSACTARPWRRPPSRTAPTSSITASPPSPHPPLASLSTLPWPPLLTLPWPPPSSASVGAPPS